ncbi:MAG TPA: hypothetical protein PLR78_05690 [Polaromonas sp.]|nr:hypothetical protein [Polaromonas sp.]
MLPLVAAVLAFILFAVTGQTRFRRMGLRILMWTLAAAFVFFGVLIFENLR